jgi:hypothetical protein
VKNDRSSAIAAWWERYGRRELAENGLAQIDIDEITEEPPADAVQAGLEYLVCALDLVDQSNTSAHGMLTIPLAASDSLSTAPPRLGDLLHAEWTYGPGLQFPGIYLLAAESWASYEASEEYRIDITATAALPEGLVAYYRCWRSVEYAVRGWEYDRTVYVRTVRASGKAK